MSQSLLKSQSSFTAAPTLDVHVVLSACHCQPSTSQNYRFPVTEQATVAISPKFAIRAVQSPAHRAPELTAAPQALAAKERYEAIQLMEVMKPATP